MTDIPPNGGSGVEPEVNEVPMITKCNRKLTSLQKDCLAVYEKLYNSLSPEKKALLKQSQMQWAKDREKKCLGEQVDFDGGTKSGLVFCDCSVLETQKRIDALKAGQY